MSATQNSLKTLFKALTNPKKIENFSIQDTEEATINEILELYNLKDASSREIKRRQPEVFALIEEVVEELQPAKITDILGPLVEVKNFARDAEPLFVIKNLGKRRAKLGIVEGARGGIYKARRLDNKSLTLKTTVQTVGVIQSLEDILLGRTSITELIMAINEGFAEKIYIEAVKALRTAKTTAPAANIKTGNGFVQADIDSLVAIAKSYGNAAIVGFRPALAKISNVTNWTSANPNVDAMDVKEYRENGIVTVYKGVPVMELPNYFTDNNNAKKVFKEGDIFILPINEAPIKVALKGELTSVVNALPAGGEEQQYHRMVGVGLMLANNVCVYTDSAIVDTNNLY